MALLGKCLNWFRMIWPCTTANLSTAVICSMSGGQVIAQPYCGHIVTHQQQPFCLPACSCQLVQQYMPPTPTVWFNMLQTHGSLVLCEPSHEPKRQHCDTLIISSGIDHGLNVQHCQKKSFAKRFKMSANDNLEARACKDKDACSAAMPYWLLLQMRSIFMKNH